MYGPDCISCRAYFRHLLRVWYSPAMALQICMWYSPAMAFLNFLGAFYHSKKIIFACCLGLFHVQIALNLLKYVLFYSDHTHVLSF